MKQKILVVDDEKTIREFVSKNLAIRDFEVLTAGNGLEALALFSSHSLDLIILEIMMPNMDGLETCRRIHKNSHLPIIVLTALGEESDRVKAFAVRAGITIVPQLRSVFPQMTVFENLELGMYLENDQQWVKERIEYIYDLFARLRERSGQNVGTMSGGEQRMLGIGRAGNCSRIPTCAGRFWVGRQRTVRVAAVPFGPVAVPARTPSAQ